MTTGYYDIDLVPIRDNDTFINVQGVHGRVHKNESKPGFYLKLKGNDKHFPLTDHSAKTIIVLSAERKFAKVNYVFDSVLKPNNAMQGYLRLSYFDGDSDVRIEAKATHAIKRKQYPAKIQIKELSIVSL